MSQKKKKFIDLTNDIIPQKETNIPLQIPCKFLNKEQADAYHLFKTNSVIVLTGPAGCGKSYLAALMAINHMLNESNNCDSIWCFKPAVASEDLGFLPGDYATKLAPYMVSIFDEVDKICKIPSLKKHITSKIKVTPLAYLRGVNMTKVMICDEAQNCTFSQLKMLLTRISGSLKIDEETGYHIGAKLIITGDLDQTDLKYDRSGLHEVVARLENCPGIAVVKFSESAIVRHPLIAEILRRLK